MKDENNRTGLLELGWFSDLGKESHFKLDNGTRTTYLRSHCELDTHLPGDKIEKIHGCTEEKSFGLGLQSESEGRCRVFK